MKPGVSSGAGLGTILEFWTAYAETKLDILQISTAPYLKIIANRFFIHFTVISLIIPVLWLWTIYRDARAGKEIKFKIVLPLLLLSTGVVYIVLVPHNTRGHKWTLYWLLPTMSTVFGIAMDDLVNKQVRRCHWPQEAGHQGRHGNRGVAD